MRNRLYYSIISGQVPVLDARITQGMEKDGDLAEAPKAIKNVADNTSWFKDTPYRWAIPSLPLAYAMACFEVVSRSSGSELYSMQARLDSEHTTQAQTMFELPFSLLE